MQSKVRFNDLFPSFGISIDCKGTIQDIQKYAHMYGGIITVYNMGKEFPNQYEKPFRISYRLSQPPFEFMIYGIEITEEQFETQILAWNGKQSVFVEPKAEITLIDNSYLLLR